jgi:integrase
MAMDQQWELGPERFLTPPELAKMLEKADELWVLGETKRRKQLVRDAFLIYTALMTGLRNSEICNLRVTDLRIGNGRSYLVVQNGKGGKTRNVHIGKQYKKILKRYVHWKHEQGELTPESYLLRTERSPKYCVSGLWRRWKKYCPKTLHCARHTNASMVYQASGNNLRMVQKQLGHSRITTTQIYADVMPEVMVEGMSAMERLARQLRKQALKAS